MAVSTSSEREKFAMSSNHDASLNPKKTAKVDLRDFDAVSVKTSTGCTYELVENEKGILTIASVNFGGDRHTVAAEAVDKEIAKIVKELKPGKRIRII